MVDRANVIAGYQTYPHVDMAQTGLRAAKATLAMVEGRASPVTAWGTCPMLPHVLRQGTECGPNAQIQRRCREIEREGALAASVFVGFPQADVPDSRLSAVVVADGDQQRASRWRDELLSMAWAARHDFLYRSMALDESIQQARMLRGFAGQPIVLLDHADNCASGGTMDTTTVLRAVLDAGLSNVAMMGICDPEAVQIMARAGIGSELELMLGGKIDMPALGLRGQPLPIHGRVKWLGEGRFRNVGPMSAGEINDMGPCVVLDTGRVEIAVISRQQEPYDIACFSALGIDPRAKDYLVLKSRVHWRAGLAAHVKGVVECAGTGVCTSDYRILSHRHVRRPLYPIDLDAAWDPP
jgi:microcystin degradation protein MlrC